MPTTLDATPSAASPERAFVSAHLHIGLLSLPISIYSGCESDGNVRSSYVHHAGKEWHPVQQAWVDAMTGELVESYDIVKGRMHEGEVIPISDAEMQAAAAGDAKPGDFTILGFVDREHFHSYRLPAEKVYQIRPARHKGKEIPGAEKTYTILVEGLARKHVYALVQFTMKATSCKRYGILDETGRLTQIVHSDKVRKDRPLPQVDTTPSERALMDRLIKERTLRRVPPMPDDRLVNIEKLIAEKIAAKSKKKRGATVQAPAPKIATGEFDLEKMFAGMLSS